MSPFVKAWINFPRLAAAPRLGGRRFTNPQADDLVIKATDREAIAPSRIHGVLEKWCNPSHEEFRPRNASSLFNAATEVMM